MYTWRETHIDLYKLCFKLNIRFIHSEVLEISANNKEIILKDRPKIKFDVLSINTGIQSSDKIIKGAHKYSIPVKPISKLSNNFLTEIEKCNNIAFIGGGPASVELALGLQKRFKNTNSNFKITIITGKNGLLNSFPNQTQKVAKKTLQNSQINVIEKVEVIEVQKDKLILSDKSKLKIDKSILSTNGMAPEWIKKSDIILNRNNFIIVNNKFQTNYDYVFAAGDIVDFNNQNLSKSGVYAVKSGKPLARSIRGFIQKKIPVSYKFNKNYLSIIGLSNGLAIATKYNFTFTSRFSFLLKKFIDKKFVKKFNDLNQDNNYIFKNLFKIFDVIIQNNKNIPSYQMQCRGCAAKVDFNSLKTTLSKEIITTSEDAININNYPKLYQSVDMISSIVSDPYIFGKIAANHAISDIVAVNSSLISALMILQLPYSNSEINSRDLEQVTSGANEILKLANCSIGGGHTMIGKDKDPVIGFSVIGEKKRVLQNKITPKVKVNDILILTEKIGSGIIFAGINNDIIDSYYQIEVINQMSKGNINFSKISEKLNILSMTDVTGFGLLNHLFNLIKRDSGKTGLTIYPDKVPIFNGVTEALSKNVRSSLFDKNFDVAQKELIYDREKKLIDEILYDPQTVGGLAFIIPKEEKVEQIKILRENKINFTEIGFVNNLNNKIKIM
ncbi:MAG: selenide, water dikinase SelD [Rhodospirillaceae bacterium]|nr:selenide, water dikinase SelD [Rhodospirillaceae bacterium]